MLQTRLKAAKFSLRARKSVALATFDQSAPEPCNRRMTLSRANWVSSSMSPIQFNGEGNFKVLSESLERDQLPRGAIGVGA